MTTDLDFVVRVNVMTMIRLRRPCIIFYIDRSQKFCLFFSLIFLVAFGVRLLFSRVSPETRLRFM